MVVASTRRVVVREFTSADVAAMTDVFGDPEVMFYGDGPQSEDWVRSWIEQSREDYRRHGFGHWAVVLRESERTIGYCGLSRFDNINERSEIELGYRLAKDSWGCGLATEAAAAVRDMAVQQLGIHRLISLIDPANRRSIRVAEKLGMTHTDNVMLPGYSHPDRVYTYVGA